MFLRARSCHRFSAQLAPAALTAVFLQDTGHIHRGREPRHLFALNERDGRRVGASFRRLIRTVGRGKGPKDRSELLGTQCYTDVMSTDELLAETLRLTRVDRARVAEELLSSLEQSDDEVATAWATELERRSREVAEGRVQTTNWETARTEILKELEARNAIRPPC